MTLQPSAPKKRGAQPGNLNALKHGFYTRRIPRADLTSLDTTQFNGLEEEIAMLRLLTRRLIDLSADALTLPEINDLLRTYCLACLTLTRLVKTQHLLAPQSLSDEAITQALQQITAEIMKEHAQIDAAQSDNLLTDEPAS
jgi:hypothetical protein